MRDVPGEDPSLSQRGIPFTVLGGYLGSGKTTLLNHVLLHSDGFRLAVIVNDFGSINIDASLIQAHNGETMALANGCICCSISSGFAEALTALSRRIPPLEHVIIEASGVADPVKVGYFGALPPYRLDGVVVVADAETLRQRAADRYVGGIVQRQLQSADLVMLNKIDLVDEPQQAALSSWLHELAPEARVFTTDHGRVPLMLLLGLHSDAAPPLLRHNHNYHDHSDAFTTWSVVLDCPLRESAFRAAVSAWPETVLRAKGIVCLADDPLRRQIFQLVGRRWSLTPDRSWNSEPPRTELVLIGLSGQLDGDTLLATLATTRAKA